MPKSPEEWAARLLLHLRATGETFIDKDYVFHELTETIRDASVEAANVREQFLKEHQR